MLLGTEDEYGCVYYTFEEVLKIIRLDGFFTIGQRISRIVYLCSICFAILSKYTIGVKFVVTAIAFVIYTSFVIGNVYVNSKMTNQ